jgi:hypothetical protein
VAPLLAAYLAIALAQLVQSALVLWLCFALGALELGLGRARGLGVLMLLGALHGSSAKMQHRCLALRARSRVARVTSGPDRTRLALLARAHWLRSGDGRSGAEALDRLQLHQSQSEAERFRPEGSRSAGVLWL